MVGHLQMADLSFDELASVEEEQHVLLRVAVVGHVEDLRDLSGDVIYEEDARGQLIPARRFSPAFWGDRFQTHRLLEEVNLRKLEADASGGTVPLQKTPRRPRRSLRDDWVQFVNQFKRAFWSILRSPDY